MGDTGEVVWAHGGGADSGGVRGHLPEPLISLSLARTHCLLMALYHEDITTGA